MPVLPPLSGLVELTVLVLAILSLGWVFPELEISDIQPNPFWLPVLLLSLQYGTVSGILAAGVALTVTVALGLPEEAVGENHFSYALRVYSQPILWFAAAVLLGQFRMRQIAAKQLLREEVAELSAQRTALAGYATGLRQRLEALERGRAGESDVPAVRLLGRIDELRRAESDLPAVFARLIENAIPGAAASIFCVTSQGLQQVAACGWQDDARWSRSLPPSHALYQAVVGSGSVRHVLDPADDADLAGEGLVAVPIPAREPGGPIVGMLKIERIAPAALTAELLPALQLLASVLSPRMSPGQQRAVPSVPVAAAVPSPQPAARTLRSIRWQPSGGAAETSEERTAAASTTTAVVH